MTQPTVYLDIEADAFGIARRHEYVFQISDYKFTYESNLGDCIHDLDRVLDRLQKHAPGHKLVICLGHHSNFRYAVFPQYKSNRRGVRKAACYNELRNFLTRNYDTAILPNVEADDALGIMHQRERGDLIYSPDKDLRTIAGTHMKMDGELEDVSELEANRSFFKQVLTGDSCDGYNGCPGVGANAKLFEDDKWLFCKEEEDFWNVVLWQYDKARKKLYERFDVVSPSKHALVMARCARILRSGEYDFEEEKPILWKGPG